MAEATSSNASHCVHASMPMKQELSRGVQQMGLAGQQAAQKKRKRAQPEAPAGTRAPQAEAPAPDADSSQHPALCFTSTAICSPQTFSQVHWTSRISTYPGKCAQCVHCEAGLHLYDATGLQSSFAQAESFTPASTGEESSESGSDETASSEEEQAQTPGKGQSRNARRKKHKRQLRRLGLLARKPAGSPGKLGNPSSQTEQQRPPAPQPQAAVSGRDGGMIAAKRTKVEAEAGR